MKTKPLTTPQVLALLRVAEHDFLGALGSKSLPAGDLYQRTQAIWMELGRCIRDIDGARLTPVNASARSAMIRRGYIRANLCGRDRHGGSLRFELTDAGMRWIEEAVAGSILIRGLRKVICDP